MSVFAVPRSMARSRERTLWSQSSTCGVRLPSGERRRDMNASRRRFQGFSGRRRATTVTRRPNAPPARRGGVGCRTPGSVASIAWSEPQPRGGARPTPRGSAARRGAPPPPRGPRRQGGSAPALPLARPPPGGRAASTRRHRTSGGLRLDLHLGLPHDIAVELHRDLEVAHGLDGLPEVEGASVELEPARGERLDDVERGDRAVELVLLAHLALQDHRRVGQPLRHRLRARLELGGLGLGALPLLLELPHVLGVGRHGQAARQEVVPPVAGLHLDELAALAQVLDVFSQDELHGRVSLRARHGVGEDGEHARALDGARDLPLVQRAVAADAARDDLAALGEEVLELPLVLVVDLERLVGAEPADLAPAEAATAALLAAAVPPVFTVSTFPTISAVTSA